MTGPLFRLAFAGLFLTGCDSAEPDDTDPPTDTDVPAECVAEPDQSVGVARLLAELTFDQPFGPDAPVQMSTVSGDRGTGAHATIGIFGPGFDSGPHVHTGDYHGVVLQGTVVNPFGDEANPVEMGPGSYWYVPAGEQHSTVCASTTEDCVFYFHATGAFDFTPIDAITEPRSAAAVAMTADAFTLEEITPFVSMAGVWGDRAAGAHGTFGEFPGNASSPAHVHSGAYNGVVISGTMVNPFANQASPPEMISGGTWEVPADAEHITTCVSSAPCRFYFHADGAFDFTPVCED